MYSAELLDSFNRADEGPPVSGWTDNPYNLGSGPDSYSAIKLASNAITQVDQTKKYSGIEHNVARPVTDGIAITLGTGFTAPNPAPGLAWPELFLNLAHDLGEHPPSGSLSPLGGYELGVYPNYDEDFNEDVGNAAWLLVRFDVPGWTSLGVAAHPVADGDRIALHYDGSTLRGLHKPAGADWQLVVAANDLGWAGTVGKPALYMTAGYTIEEAVIARETSYFDGGFSSSRWTGTAHNSTSEQDEAGFLLIGASDLVTTGYAGATNASPPAGAHSASTVQATLISDDIPLRIAAIPPQVHEGLWRPRLRVHASEQGSYVRVVTSDRDSQARWIRVPNEDDWYAIAVDSLTGPWKGWIEARGTGTVDVDHLTMMPARKGAARAPQVATTLTGATAYDTMVSHSAGDLTGKTAPAGGTWSEAGDTAGHTIPDPEDGWVHRTTVSDADLNTGTYQRLGTGAATNVEVRAEVEYRFPAGLGDLRQGVFARYTDPNNWFMAVVISGFFAQPISDGTRLLVLKRVAGTVTTVEFLTRQEFPDLTQADLILEALDSGVWSARWDVPGGALEVTGEDSDLATGGSLASGGYGIYDAYTGSTALTRRYRNFIVAAPSASGAALFPDRTLHMTHELAERENADGSEVERVPVFDGQHLTIPPATRTGRKSRLVVRARQLDVDLGSRDVGLSDGVDAELSVTPRVFLTGG